MHLLVKTVDICVSFFK